MDICSTFDKTVLSYQYCKYNNDVKIFIYIFISIQFFTVSF